MCRAAGPVWFDNGWAYRREVTVPADVAGLPAAASARVEFYTDGHALPAAADVVVATDDGKVMPHDLLAGGDHPGDRVRLRFAVRPGTRRYFAYFGNPAPPPPAKPEHPIEGGLLMETRAWTGGDVRSFDHIRKSFDRSTPVLGQTILDHPFLGYNPFGDQVQYVSKLTGTMTLGVEGDYQIALAVDDEGGLWIDDQPVVFAHLGGGDARYHASLHLARGPHAFTLYHCNAAGEGYFSVGRKLAAGPKYEVMPRSSFGTCLVADVGPLEAHDKALVADPGGATLLGESFVAGGYALRYHVAAKSPVHDVKFEWDFGDGQHAAGPDADHVYLEPGVYPVKLTLRAGPNVDSATARLVVERNYRYVLEAKDEPAVMYATLTAGYDVAALPGADLPRLVQLDAKAERLDAALVPAGRLAGSKAVPNASAALEALQALDERLVAAKRADAAVTMWDKAPADSALQPAAAARGAELACWWTGDFAKAAKLLAPFAPAGDPALKRLYGQSLVLAGRVDEGRKVLAALPVDAPAARAAALSGAAARTVEFFLTEKDPESGEAAWDKWMTRFPADFLDGYAVVLRTKLMAERGRGDAAARVAEAYAAAVPTSSYAPQLLDAASKLLAATDPTKSQALRQQLKLKYPEDPLSQ